MMYLGYNTNGLAHHRLEDAIELLAEIGYRGVAITIDHSALPPGRTTAAALRRLRRRLEGLAMRSVIETGARYLLDRRRKHEPTLISRDPAARGRRIDFYRHALECAGALGSDCLSLWSGCLPADASSTDARGWLEEGLAVVLEQAGQLGVRVGFEPEPGMLIDRMEGFEELSRRFAAAQLGLTLDVGHLQCQGETPLEAQIRRWAKSLVNVHLEDMRCGCHEHLLLGEGEIDFPPVIASLAESDYAGGVFVELSRHSHVGPQAAQAAYDFLTRLHDWERMQ